MDSNKLDALYGALLSYAVTVIEEHREANISRKDRIYNICNQLAKEGYKAAKNDKKLLSQKGKEYYREFRKIEADYFDGDKDYSAEVIVVSLALYLVAEHRYDKLIAKVSVYELFKILDELEKTHRNVTFAQHRLVSKFIDTEL